MSRETFEFGQDARCLSQAIIALRRHIAQTRSLQEVKN